MHGGGAQHEVTTMLLNLECSNQLQILRKRTKLVSNLKASWDGTRPSAMPVLAALRQVTHTGMLYPKTSQSLGANPQEKIRRKKCRGKTTCSAQPLAGSELGH